MASALDSSSQTALLALGEAGLLACFDLSINVYIALQSLEIFVVKIWNVGALLKYLCHNLNSFRGYLLVPVGEYSFLC